MLQVGASAPSFALHDVNGKRHALELYVAPLTLALFFKTTCPTCQYAWQYYERLHQAYARAGLKVFGISQHDIERTRAYQQEYNATFPHLVDETLEVSRAYDPEFVPTGFLIDEQGKIVETIVAWQSARVNEFAAAIAQQLRVPTQTIVRPEDNAAVFKAG